MPGKQEQVEINIQEDMDVSKRAELVAKLEYETGVVSAFFKGGDRHHLTVRYDTEYFSDVTLLDAIREHGFHGEVSRE